MKTLINAHITAKHKRAKRVMRAALGNPGVDPYNSADTFGRKFERSWNDEQRRRSERWANQELASHAAG